MKICPNCGAENDDIARVCILCEFEFDNEEGVTFPRKESEDIIGNSEGSEENHINKKADDYISLNNTETTHSKESSKAIVALIIIFLIVGGIIGCVVLLKNNGKSSSKDSKGSNKVSSQSTTNQNNNDSPAATTTTNTENAMLNAQTTTISTTTITNTTTKSTSTTTYATTASQIIRYPASDLDNYPQYKNAVDDIKKEINDSLWASDFGDELYYELIDISNDNTPELFVSNAIGSKFFLYSIVNNKATFITSATSMHGNTLYEDGTIVLSFHDATTINNTYLKYYGGYSVEKLKESDVSLGNYVELRPTKLCDLKTKSVDEYNDTSNLWAIGKVTTKSTTLNMREEPSTSADVITQIPNGTYLGIIGISTIDNDWYYVKYYATTSSPIYYGYVHKDYVTITEWL